MKTKLTLLTVLLCCLKISAQTITYSNFSKILTDTQSIRIADNSSFNMSLITTTGNGVTWNASGISPATGIPIINLSYGNPSSTPNGGLFTQSNYSKIDPALVAVMEYEYYNFNSDSMVFWGNYAPSAAHEIFQDPDKRMIFPFSYSESFSDNYAKTNYSDATTVSSNQTGTRTVNFNGFGTLILPQGTFTNVALISELRTNSLGPNSPSYSWIDINNGITLLTYHENSGSTTIGYYNETPTGFQEFINNAIVSIYPNPSKNNFTISLGEVIKCKIEIYNPLGENVYSDNINQNSLTINCEQFIPGIYFVKVMGDKK